MNRHARVPPRLPFAYRKALRLRLLLDARLMRHNRRLGVERARRRRGTHFAPNRKRGRINISIVRSGDRICNMSRLKRAAAGGLAGRCDSRDRRVAKHGSGHLSVASADRLANNQKTNEKKRKLCSPRLGGKVTRRTRPGQWGPTEGPIRRRWNFQVSLKEAADFV